MAFEQSFIRQRRRGCRAFTALTIRFLLGEEPTEVFARIFRPAGDPRFEEVDATVIWQMRFPSGVLANSMCSFDAHDTKSCRAVAERGRFGMDSSFPYRGLKNVPSA